MATWPSSLPQTFHQQGFEISAPAGAIRTEMDTGVPFQRRRYSAAVEPVVGKMWLDSTQYGTLLDFWRTTTAMGAIEFSWVHPITGNAAQFRFNATEPPRVTVVTASLFEVQLSLEILP